MATQHIAMELTWKSLRDMYFIGTVVTEELKRTSDGKVIMENGQPVTHKVGKMVNKLQEAIDDGTLDALVKKSAEMYSNGDVAAVIASMVRNLDSERQTLKNRPTVPSVDTEMIRFTTLEKFVAARRTSKPRDASNLPQWAYGPAEIDKIDDPAKLQKIINSINDVCCDKSHVDYGKKLGADYVNVAKANRLYAQKRKQALESKVNQLPEDLIAKITSGKKVTLNEKQAAALAELLKNI